MEAIYREIVSCSACYCLPMGGSEVAVGNRGYDVIYEIHILAVSF